MPVSKANQRAVNKYVKNNYDRINVTMPKGKRDIIQTAASGNNLSVNAYINQAIDERMERDNGASLAGMPTESAQKLVAAGMVSLPPDTLERAQAAAMAAGESVTDFLTRAVELASRTK